MNNRPLSALISLQQIACVNVVTRLFDIPDVKNDLCELYMDAKTDEYIDRDNLFSSSKLSYELSIIRLLVRVPVQKMESPIHLHEEILNTFDKMVIQVIKWIAYHNNVFSGFLIVNGQWLNSLRWTPHGLINKKRTAELLVKDHRIDIEYRFKLACIYCLETDISILWSQIPDTIKTQLSNNQESNYIPHQQDLVKLWSHNLRKPDDLIKTIDFNECGFKIAIQSDNTVSSTYFWLKLQPTRREELLINYSGLISTLWQYRYPLYHSFYVIGEYYADILYFLMTQMNEVQQVNFLQEDVIRNKVSTALSSFFMWPYQDLFIPTAKLTWDFLPVIDYSNILNKIISKIVSGEKDYNYRNLLREFWLQSPIEVKRSFLESYDDEFLTRYLRVIDSFISEDAEIISSILKYATAEEKDFFNFEDEGKSICSELIRGHKWKLVELLAVSCLSTNKQRRIFKQNVIMSINDGGWFTEFISKSQWVDLERFLNWCLLPANNVPKKDKKKKKVVLYKHTSKVIAKFYWWCLSSLEKIDMSCQEYRYKAFTFKNVFQVIEAFVQNYFYSKQAFSVFKINMIFQISKENNLQILKLISEDKLEIIQNFVSYCFLSSEKKADKCKKEMIHCIKDQAKFHLIYKNGFESLKKLIIWCLSDDEERGHYTKDLIQSMKNKIQFHNFIYNGRIEEIDGFICWCLSSDEEIHHFKRMLFLEIIKKSKVKDLIYEKDLYKLQKFINWCSSSEQLVLKKELMNSIKDHKDFKSFVYKNKFKWIKIIISWSFTSQEDRDKFSKELMHSLLMDKEFYDLVYQGNLKLIDEFMCWCLPLKEEITLFKKEFLFYIKDKCFKDLVYCYNLKFLDKLITWCLPIQEEKATFMVEFISSFKYEHKFINFLFKDQLKYIDKFIIWCLPTKESLTFKKELIYAMMEFDHFKKVISDGIFDLIEKIVNWGLSTQNEIVKFKTDIIESMKDDQRWIPLIRLKGFQWMEGFISWCFTSSMKKIAAKKELIYSMLDNFTIQTLIHEDRLKLVDEVVNLCLLNEEDIQAFKKKVFYSMKENKTVVYQNEFKTIMSIISWSFPLEQEKNKVASKLIYSVIGDPELHDLILGEKIEMVEGFITWCLATEKDVCMFKRQLFQSIAKTSPFQTRIDKDNIALIERIFSWCSLTEEDICIYKNALMSSMTDNVDFFNLADGHIEKIEQFISWCSSSEEDILKYKKKLLYSIIKNDSIRDCVLWKKSFDLFELLISWGLQTRDEICTFKKDLMYSLKDDKGFLNLIYNNPIEQLEGFLVWCSTSERVVSQFKKELIYSMKVDNNFKIFLLEDRFDQIVKIISWGLPTQEEISTFKNELKTSLKVDLYFLNLILNCKLEYLDKFISWCIPYKVDICKFKKEILYSIKDSNEGEDLLLINTALKITNVLLGWTVQRFDELLIWGLSTEDEICDFKKKLMLSLKNGDMFFNLIYENRIDQIEELMSWCSLSETDMSQFKKEICYSILDDTNFKDYKDWEGKFELIKKLITWGLLTEGEIVSFKKDLMFSLKDDQNLHNFLYQNQSNVINRFIFWCSLSKQEICQFKKAMLYSMKKGDTFISLILRNNFNMVDKFIAWGLSSEQDICEFKREFMYSMGGYHELHKYMYEDKSVVERFISWCSTSESDISKFKKEMLYSLKEDYKFKKILWIDNLEVLDSIITFCLLTDEEICIFKNELMSSMDDEYFRDFMYKNKLKVFEGSVSDASTTDYEEENKIVEGSVSDVSTMEYDEKNAMYIYNSYGSSEDVSFDSSSDDELFMDQPPLLDLLLPQSNGYLSSPGNTFIRKFFDDRIF